MNKIKFISIFFAFLMLSGIFTLIIYIPSGSTAPYGASPSQPVLASTIASSYSSTAFLNTSTNFWHSVSLSNTGDTSVGDTAVENSTTGNVGNPFGIDSTQSWTVGTTTVSTSVNIPSFYYWGSTTMSLPIEFQTPKNVNDAYEVGTVYANLTSTATSGLPLSSSYTYSYDSTQIGEILFDPSWNFQNQQEISFYDGVFTLTITITTFGTHSDFSSMANGIWTDQETGNSIVATTGNPYYTYSADSWAFGWHWNGVSASFTPASNLESYDFSWSSPYSVSMTYNGGTQTGTSDYFAGSLTSYSFSYTVTNDPPGTSFDSSGIILDGPAPSFSVSYNLSSQVQAQQVTNYAQSFSGSQNPTQQQNWWNSTLSLTLTDPSGSLNNPSCLRHVDIDLCRI